MWTCHTLHSSPICTSITSKSVKELFKKSISNDILHLHKTANDNDDSRFYASEAHHHHANS